LKRCPSCGLIKQLSDFPNNRATKDGKATYCKPCHNLITRRNKERRYGGERQFLIKHRYGFDPAEVEWALLRQNYKCALCGDHAAEHVDHRHSDGELRGVLCFNCNRALGYFDDDWEILCRAGDYLEAHGVE
jgi:5-methylcytosine-specific restriction endonuclease McrA